MMQVTKIWWDGERLMAEPIDPASVYQEPAQQEPVALETVYETIIHWDEGGGKRSRRELARRIVDLYTSPPAQEPVGEVLNERGEVDWISFVPTVGTPLYTHPQARGWVRLTEEEIDRLRHLIDWTAGWSYAKFARAIEALCKEKNA